MSPSTLLLTVFAYTLVLFWVARLGDKEKYQATSITRHPLVYALALGVYCTSWTFYGLVGTASTRGWGFLPILLGPMLLFTLGFPLLQRISRICKQEHIHSIADFLASRYGKRQAVAATTTLVVLLATVPYIALQLKAVSDTLILTMEGRLAGYQNVTLLIALSMAAFALIFGARRLDVSGYHSGLMSAIAFESLVKLIALVILAVFAVGLLSQFAPPQRPAPLNGDSGSVWAFSLSLRAVVETLVAACTIFCLPRMFHVTFVEQLSERHLHYSRWVFSGYLLAITACIVVIAAAGNVLFAGRAVSGDTYVLAMPLLENAGGLSLLAFIGGFSAATAMIIVATITLSQMLSNDVILPLLMRSNAGRGPLRDYSGALIFTRRATVLVVVGLAYLYQVALAENVALTSIGLIAFALAVQLAPAIVLGMYWKTGNSRGVYAGLACGLGFWFYTLMLPLLARAGLIDHALLTGGLFNLSWLRPESLFNLTFSDAYTRGVVISLSANLAAFVFFSRRGATTLADRIQARAFCYLDPAPKTAQPKYADIALDDLKALLEQFLGAGHTADFLARHHSGDNSLSNQLVDQAEQTLSGVVGVASAKAMVNSLRTGENLAVEDVVNIFEETTRALRFNQDILFASFENISSAISIVNSDLQMVAWNRRYEDMFNYPQGMLNVGRPVADLVRFNARRGMLGPGSEDEHVKRRLTHLQSGKPYRVVRDHSGTVIEIKGLPLPNGGYVTTYDDITDFISTQKALEQTNTDLEDRVRERTETIEQINKDLRAEIRRRERLEQEMLQAKSEAEQANASKTKFLALASHDILQPLNAANLYASALLEKADNEGADATTTQRLQTAIQSAESIISSLMEIAKLDTGALAPETHRFSLNEILQPLVDEFRLLTGGAVALRYRPCSVLVKTDRHYLRRILQNFLSNAVKYTQTGRILVGCRRRGDSVEIQVIDTGPGISEADQKQIFNDFYRADAQRHQTGAGLGLAVAARFGSLLGTPIRLQSELGKGSCFTLLVPVTRADTGHSEPDTLAPEEDLGDLTVLYVDDEAQNLDATQHLLERWQCRVTTAQTTQQARAAGALPAPDVMLMDYHLNDENYNGIQLATELCRQWSTPVEVCIVSAAGEVDLPRLAAAQGYQFLRKPVRPGKLRALLAQFKKRLQTV
ncbi:response regulator [Exilibacterium tricleocarpae]|uniref:histidine kinase n=1 Tax=Exilibacterium tricleocarpae TaxID=2591008 RepID=A0A545U8D7_9GAMM|nr:PAS domain-containing hybrid sensor histidine kinase/response regulator [Exilibacterium tricleocarpae]TQV85663.1 response regulator [Exilibacterium tricleocarpae]